MRKIKWLTGCVALLAIVTGITAIIISGCSSNSDSGGSAVSLKAGTVVLVGTIGDGYQKTVYAPPFPFFDNFLIPSFINTVLAYGTGTEVDKIIAIPCRNGGDLDEYSMPYTKEAIISMVDGSFSLQLEKDSNWVLLLVKSSLLPDAAAFVGYVALDDGAGNCLLQMPASTAVADSLDLGNLVSNTDVAIADNAAITASAFSMSVSNLVTLAKNDESLKMVKNFYLNYDKATGIYYNLKPYFKWMGDYAELVSTNGASPSNYAYRCYQLEFYTNSPDLTVNKLCANGTPRVYAELVPPADVPTWQGITYSASFPISNTYATSAYITNTKLTYTDFFFTDRDGGGGGGSMGSDNLKGAIPAGDWIWKHGSVQGATVEKARFDLAVTTPLTGINNSKIIGFVPALKVITGTDNVITSIQVKWYILNDAGTDYTELTDLSVLKYVTTSASYWISSDGVGTRYESNPFNPSIQTSITPQLNDWYYKDGGVDPAKRVYCFGVSYTSGGVGIFIECYNN